ncbi:tyrosine-type recombinase/integrase [Amphibacillus sp. MSJ-3]|uniref:tyrosine-type recombinase/integrase n=1 Tax=Amphibacillus sp. MSJ-3 TaxID=2841505 RepID=UPI001C0F15AA|nr:tyrosine-type recombinase/integrase [Amphibacillus sp. MSJ-3]MBU5595476.1 tyrosine-type recombinase/integrase [Amphibacillus sp. MSJ-3]
MSAVEPIIDASKIRSIINASNKNPTRNYCFVLLALHTGLRMKDLLQLKKKDLYDDEILSFLYLSSYQDPPIYLNPQMRRLINAYVESQSLDDDDYLFQSKETSEPLSRQQANRIIKQVASEHNITGLVSMHTLRKTFAYHAYRNGIAISLIQKRLGQKTLMSTKRYIGLDNLKTAKIKIDVRF